MAFPIISKECNQCLRTQPIIFFRQHRTKDGIGYRSKCRDCTRLDSAKWKFKNGSHEAITAVQLKIERERFLSIYVDRKYCKQGDHYPLKTSFNKIFDRLQAYCRDCQRKHRQENLDSIRRRKREIRSANRDKFNKQQREWVKKNWDRISLQRKMHRVLDPDYFRRQAERSYKKNKDKIKENSKYQGIKRRAIKLKAKGTFSPQLWLQKLAFHGWKCYLCGVGNKKLEQDHRVPLSRGGSNWLANLAPACVTCNRKKHNKTEREYRQHIQQANFLQLFCEN